ncbi:hypothetical protein [Azospirillum sp. B2RO_4]|uniref:hypothetical protein n=1 Tax=Azospirillum sp. B2RO_4 TaxID=3027796 RepID=UPI003DA803F0
MDNAYAKILRTDFAKLPAPVRRVYLAPPVLSFAVQASGNSFTLVDPGEADRPSPEALMPKLGVKSWRDGGTLGIIYQGMSMRVMLELLLQHPTRAQLLSTRAWTRTNTPLFVRLARYVDFSDISEVRYLIRKSGISRVSACLRGRTARALPAISERLSSAATKTAESLGDGSWVVDFGILPDGSIRIVDVNPGLSPQDIASIKG